MDTLLKRLESEGYGFWIGSHYFGSAGYADDLKLLSPTIYGLRKMTVICEEFGEEYGVKYNPTKTACILYARKAPKVKPRVDLCGTELQWVNTVKLLGNYLHSNLSEKSKIIKKKGDLIQIVNNLIVSLGRSSDIAIKKAFNTQCAHLHGAPAWDFSDVLMKDFQIMWNRCVRRILQLTYATYTRFLPQMIEISSVTDQIYGRFLKMFKVMEHAKNSQVLFRTKLSISTPRSIIGSNLRTVNKKLHMNNLATLMDEGCKKLREAYITECVEEDYIALSVIHEQRGFLGRSHIINGFNIQNIEFVLDFISTQ